jgi:dTMP kinase
VSLFITFEGAEGSGKSTQVALLGKALAEHDPILTREPGGTKLGERIREILLNSDLDIDGTAEMYLFMAARKQLIAEVIKPSLAAGRIVIADRYHDSTIAYQGGGRQVDTAWPATFPRPDVTFLLALSVHDGRARLKAAGKSADRMERESVAFHERVVAVYDRLAAVEPNRIVRIDASQPAEAIHATVLARVRARLAAPRA